MLTVDNFKDVIPLWLSYGVHTFLTPVFSLLGAKVTSGNFCSREWMFRRMKVPWNECSPE